MSAAMEKAFEGLLALLPECRCGARDLARGGEYFQLEARDIEKAAQRLPLDHDLKYEGVRRLLALCLEEFAGLFADEAEDWCELSVPAPLCAMYALQEEAGELRLSTKAFFAQIVLRSILLGRQPLDPSSCPKRRCGLNNMRRTLLTDIPGAVPRCLMQFGVLCDECVKIGEGLEGEPETFSLCFPAGEKWAKAYAEHFYERLEESLGVKPGARAFREACALYGRLLRAESDVRRLSLRRSRQLLWGNSLALAQSVQLMVSPRNREFIEALELLAVELENAPEGGGEKRIYCFYIPFLQPDIETRFRENGVALVGSAAFLNRKMGPDYGLAGMTRAWLDSMLLRAGPEEQCAAIARDMADWGSRIYLTGAFGFDRRLGALVPAQRRILKEKYAIDTRVLDVDFWGENAMFGSPLERVDQISQT